MQAFVIMVVASGFLKSCKSNPTQKIVGVWIPIDEAGKKVDAVKLKFTADSLSIAEFAGSPPDPGDTSTFEIGNSGKMLITYEKIGGDEEFEILKLGYRDLQLYSKKRNDTLIFVRE